MPSLRDGEVRYGPGVVAGRRRVSSIRILKIALPCLAVLLILLAVAWPRLFSTPPANAPRMTLHEMDGLSGSDVRLVKPRYGGMDARGRPFLVTAERAVQDQANADLVRLARLQADITLTNGTWLSLSAPSGLYRIDEKLLDLSGGVDVFSDRGYELHSPDAHLDLDKSVAEGSNGVQGQGPLGHLTAARYRFEQDGQHLTLTGQVHVTYYPDAPS